MKNIKFLSVLALVGFLGISCSTTSKYRPLDTKGLSFDEAIKALNTPEKINAWMLRNLAWVNRRSGRTWKRPVEMYQQRQGCCVKWANLAAYLLDHNGYEVRVVFGRYPPGHPGPLSGHAVCAYKKDGKWYVAGDSRGRMGFQHGSFGLGGGPFKDLKGVAEYVTFPYGLADYEVDGAFLTFAPKSLMKRYEDVKLNWPK
jgi:hypothetical protein